MNMVQQITVLVRSHHAAVGVTECTLPYPTAFGIIALPTRLVQYADTLDDGQVRVLCAARELAKRSGLGLRVRDVARENIVVRTFRRLAGKRFDAPLVQVPGHLVHILGDGCMLIKAERPQRSHIPFPHASRMQPSDARTSLG